MQIRQESPGQMAVYQSDAARRRAGTKVNEAIRERVINGSTAEEGGSSFGNRVYVQTGPSIARRIADIKPGDIIILQDAKLKGLKPYHQNIGQGAPVVAITDEYRSRKSTVKAYQACQQANNQVRDKPRTRDSHVSLHAVELVTCRLEDSKSGAIKISRAHMSTRADLSEP